MLVFSILVKPVRVSALLFGWIILGLTLVACSDEATPTSLSPTATIATTETSGAVPTSAPNPSETPAEEAISAYTPGATVAATFGSAPMPRMDTTPTPTAVYGSLTPPPRTLAPRTFTPAASATGSPATKSPLPNSSFIVSTSNGLYIVDANGQNDRLLASGAVFSNPKVSADGTRVAVFRTDPISLRQQLYLIDVQGRTQAISNETGYVQNFSWSPDSKTLALTRATDSNSDGLTDGNDKANIWLYDVASGKQQQVAEGRNPAWSLDGVRLVFVIPGPPSALNDIDPSTHKPRRSPNALGVYNIQNSGKRTLVSSDKLNLSLNGALEDPASKNKTVSLRYFKEVSWHPDSKHMTASADAISPDGLRVGLIVTLTIEDANPRLLTAGGEAAARSKWSPDGTRLVYEVEPQYPIKAGSRGGPALGLFDNPDFNVPRPTKLFVGDAATRNPTHDPLWLNTQQLAYLKGDSGILAVADADGKNERTLLSGCTGFDWYP